MKKTFSNAVEGIITLIKEERNAKLHLISTILIIVCGNYLGFGPTEWIWISLAIAGVWVAELINSAIERIVDIVSPEYHPLAKKAKDFTAGAVLVMSIWALFIFFILVVPKLYLYLMLNAS